MASNDKGLWRRWRTQSRSRAAWDAIFKARTSRRIFDWDLGTVLRGLVWELGVRPRLQPIPVRIRRRR